MNKHITEGERFSEWQHQVDNARADGCTCSATTYIVNNDTEYASLETVWKTNPECKLHNHA